MKFDCIVIGSGLAGLTVAYGLKKAGQNVAIVEADKFGGVVNNIGSTRKKELVTVAEHYLQNQRFEAHGITSPVSLNWEETMHWINSLEDTEDSNHQLGLTQAGITTIYGTAEFVSKNEISVNGIHYTTKNVVIASGGTDRPFDFKGNQYLSDSAVFLTQKELPKDIIFVGAGIISFAFMTIATAFGAKVRVLQHDALALRNFDQDFVSELLEINKKRGIDFHFNERIVEIVQLGTGRVVVTTNVGNQFEVDKVYNVAGRIPTLASLKVENAQIAYDEHGIIVNDFLETNQPNIFACGDCCNAAVPKLATYAVYQAEYLVSYLLRQNLAPIHYPISAMSIFSEPRIAQTGVTTAQAIADPTSFEIELIDISKWMDSKKKAEKIALLKAVIRKSDERLVGATVISQEADILINYITMGLHANWTKEDLKKQIYAYPSIVNDMERFWR